MDHGPLNEREPHHTSVGPGHQTVAEGDQDEQHHEKKSVFTKVKARAKKMKDTFTGHGHGVDEEGDEDDQEKFEDPKIHDSPAARNEDLPTSVAGRETFDRTKPQEHDHELGANHRPSKQSSSYTDKISYPTTGIAADKAVSDKNVEASTFGYGDKDNKTGVHDHEGVGGRPSSDQSSYTQKISSATSAIADRAVSAKNLVALKLGYGEKDNEVPSTGTFGTANQQQQQRGVEGNNKEKGGGGGGGGSVKGYFAEKLKPGEEDKALSEVITESLYKRKPEQQQKQEAAPRPVGEVISDAMHKRNDDPDGEVNSRPMGKVTASEEVARRLGDTKDDQAPENKGMVDKIKGAVGSWLGTGDQSPGSQPGSARDDTGHPTN